MRTQELKHARYALLGNISASSAAELCIFCVAGSTLDDAATDSTKHDSEKRLFNMQSRSLELGIRSKLYSACQESFFSKIRRVLQIMIVKVTAKFARKGDGLKEVPCNDCEAGRYLPDQATDASKHDSKTVGFICGEGQYSNIAAPFVRQLFSRYTS